MALEYANAALEIHRYVVGPYDNNVYVLRCKSTGEADASRDVPEALSFEGGVSLAALANRPSERASGQGASFAASIEAQLAQGQLHLASAATRVARSVTSWVERLVAAGQSELERRR